jgi:hypothetical protein
LDLRPDAQTTDPIGRIVGALRPLASISYGADGQFAGWSSQPVDPTSFEARLIARLEMAQRAMRGPDDPSTHAAQLLDPVPDPDTGPRAAD